MNNLRFLAAVYAALTINSTHAQTFEWAKHIGNYGIDRAEAMTTDSQGYVYTTGVFETNDYLVDFDPGPGTYDLVSAGNFDTYIIKTDAEGNMIWAKNMGGIGSEQVRSIAVDNQGNVITTGFYHDMADFDPGPNVFELIPTSGFDIFISKLDSEGNFLWAKTIGGSDWDEAKWVDIDNENNVCLTGHFQATVDFDPGNGTNNLTATGLFDTFILKLNADGNFIWAKNFGGTDGTYGTGISADTQNNISVSGYYLGTTDFDTGNGTFNSTALGDTDLFVVKLDVQGNFMWAAPIGGDQQDVAYAIATDLYDNVLVSGTFASGPCDFDPGTGVANLFTGTGHDIFVLKLAPDGVYSWATRLSGSSSDYSHTVTVDNMGNVYIAGYFWGPFMYNNETSDYMFTPYGFCDIYVAKLTAIGNVAWIKRMGGEYTDSAWAIAVDSNYSVYTAGSFYETCDFDPGIDVFNLTSVNISEDIFIHKISQPTGIEELAQYAGLEVFPNPATATLNVAHQLDGGTIFYRIESMDGKCIEEKILAGNSVHVQHLPSGLYTFILFNENQSFASARFIRE